MWSDVLGSLFRVAGMCVKGVRWDEPESKKTGEGDRTLEGQEGPAGSATRSPFSQPVHFLPQGWPEPFVHLPVGSLRTQCLTILGLGSFWLSKEEEEAK